MPVQLENISIKWCGQFPQKVKYSRSNTAICATEYIFPELEEISSFLFSFSYVLPNALSFSLLRNVKDFVALYGEMI